MGYYSTLQELPKIKQDKVEEIEEIQLLKDYGINIDGSDGEYFLVCEESSQKWRDDKKIALALSPFVDTGLMWFIGEDGVLWGYGFNNSKVYELKFDISISEAEVV